MTLFLTLTVGGTAWKVFIPLKHLSFLAVERCPLLCENFLKLAKIYYYNYCAFFNLQKDFVVQAGDPTDSGEGGSSVWYHIDQQAKEQKGISRLFKPERYPNLKHAALGTLSMAISGQGGSNGGCGSIFFITLQENATHLDGKHAPFGRCVEDDSFETLRKFNTEVMTDEAGKPLRDIRIRHVVVLDDPFPDPEYLNVPPDSPLPTSRQLNSLRVGEDEELPDEGSDQAELERIRREREARAQALTLEMVGDLPFADVAPPENVLFVCKLNAVTRSEDLELIFSRFGSIMSCEVIRDKKTGDSLNYAFIEFDQKEEAERAYVKMDNVLIDDRRIHVDFSQSELLTLPEHLFTTHLLPAVLYGFSSLLCLQLIADAFNLLSRLGVSKLHNDWIYQRTGGRPRLNYYSKDSPLPSRRDSSPPSSRFRKPASGNGNGMVFDFDEYEYRDRSKEKGERNGYERSKNSVLASVSREGRKDSVRDLDRRRRSRSRERSPRRDINRDGGYRQRLDRDTESYR